MWKDQKNSRIQLRNKAESYPSQKASFILFLSISPQTFDPFRKATLLSDSQCHAVLKAFKALSSWPPRIRRTLRSKNLNVPSMLHWKYSSSSQSPLMVLTLKPSTWPVIEPGPHPVMRLSLLGLTVRNCNTHPLEATKQSHRAIETKPLGTPRCLQWIQPSVST